MTITPGQIYRHFKGNTYKIDAMIAPTNALKGLSGALPLVLYSQLSNSSWWLSQGTFIARNATDTGVLSNLKYLWVCSANDLYMASPAPDSPQHQLIWDSQPRKLWVRTQRDFGSLNEGLPRFQLIDFST